jgi:hypothetical protein
MIQFMHIKVNILEVLRSQREQLIHIVFDRDARRSGPTLHFVAFQTLVQKLL